MTTESLSVTIEGELLTVEIGTVAAPTGGGGGSAAWGDITGTLSAQTDLQSALDLKAPLASPTLTGTPAAPTAAGGTSTTQIATTAFAAGEITTHAASTDPHGDRSFATSAVSTHAALTTGVHGLGGASQLNVGTTAGTVAAGDHAHAGVYQPLATVLTNTTAAFTTAQETKLSGIETAADVTDAGNVGAAIDGATAKTTPVDADAVPLIDSAAGNVLKKLSWANIKATAKTYFDTLYQAASATLTTWATITPGTGVGTALGTNVGTAGSVVVNGGALGTPSSGNLGSCTFPTLNQNTSGYAEALKSATTTVTVSAATAPSSGQVLTATSSTAATWQTPTGGSPAGSGTELQYRNGSSFGAMSGTAWNNTTRSMAITGATVTASAPILDLSQTWNNAAVTFTGVNVNVTNTASAAGSLLQDWRVGGVSQSRITKAGHLDFRWQAGAIIQHNGTTVVGVNGANIELGAGFLLSGSSNVVSSGVSFAWSSTSSPYSTPDVFLSRDSAGILAIRNGVNAKTLRVYGTYTDASNYVRASLAATSTAVTLAAETAGTGANDVPVILTPAGTSQVEVGNGVQFTEMTAPSAPAANKVILFAQDNGAGKTQLMALFPSGASQQVAIEP